MCDHVGLRTRLGRPPTIAPTPDLAAVLNFVVDAVTVQDGNGRLVYANAVAARLSGFDTPDELLGADPAVFGARYTIYDEQGAPFPRDRLPGRLVLDGQDAQEALLRYREEATGAEFWAVVHATPLTAADGSRLAVNVVRDVTDRVNAERALRERETRLRAVLAAMPDLMFVQAPDGTYIDFHANVEDRLFVPPPAFLGKKAADVLPSDVAAAVTPALEHTAKTGELSSVDYSLPISGEECHYEARLVRLDEDRVLSIVRDITDRVRTEAALEERQRFADRIAAASPAILYVFDMVLARTVYVNQAVSRLLGYDSETIFDIAEPQFSELLHPEDQARWPEMAAEIAAAADGEVLEQSFRLRHASGEWCWMASRVTVLTRTPDGDPHLIVAAALDISAQRAAEDALRESEARYRAVVDLQTELVSRYLPDSRLTFVNDAYCRYLGQTNEQLIGTPFLQWLPPSERPGMLRDIESIQATSEPVAYEHTVLMPDGSNRRIQWVDRAVRDVDGQVVELQGVGRDVTAQRAAEDALRESEARYRAVVQSQTELVTRYLPDTTLTFVNDAYCRYFDQSREALVGQPFIQWLPPSESAYMLDILESIMAGSGPLTSEHDVVKPDGSIGRMQWVDHAIRDASGDVVELQGVGRDITELRRVEEALRESEARYRDVVDSQVDLVSRYLPDTTLTFVNDAYCRFYGRARDELIGSRILDLIPSSSHAYVLEQIQLLMASSEPMTSEHEMYRHDGSIGRMQWVDRAIRDANGQVVELQGVGRDVTELRQAQDALQTSETQLRLALENAAMGTWDWNVATNWIAWSPGSGPLCGLPPGTAGVTTEEFYARVHPDDRARLREEEEKRLQDAADYDVEFRIVWPDGATHWLERRGKAVARDMAGRATRFLGITTDVTGRKQSEATLRRLSHQLLKLQDDERRRLARELHDGVAQDVFAVTVALSSVEKGAECLSPRSQVALDEAQGLAEQVLRTLRTQSYLLHPPVLDMAGLVPALREYASGLARRGEFQIDISAVEDVGRLPAEVETTLFRVAQEALSNVARHAGTDRATLALRSEGDMVELRVADQGKGRESHEVPLATLSAGVGIPSMRERLRLIGGELELASGPGWTTVTARTPKTLSSA